MAIGECKRLGEGESISYKQAWTDTCLEGSGAAIGCIASVEMNKNGIPVIRYLMRGDGACTYICIYVTLYLWCSSN